MRRSVIAAALIAMALLSNASRAETIICSNPEREKILASSEIILLAGDIDKLEDAFQDLSGQIGMTTWGTEFFEDGKTLTSKTLGLQSPKVSVSISSKWKRGAKRAKLVAKRTCYTDDLEPWSDYWNDLMDGLKSKGFKFKP